MCHSLNTAVGLCVESWTVWGGTGKVSPPPIPVYSKDQKMHMKMKEGGMEGNVGKNEIAPSSGRSTHSTKCGSNAISFKKPSLTAWVDLFPPVLPKHNAGDPIPSLLADTDKNSAYLLSRYWVPALSSGLRVCQPPRMRLARSPVQPSLLRSPHSDLSARRGKFQRSVSRPLHSLPRGPQRSMSLHAPCLPKTLKRGPCPDLSLLFPV